MIDILILIVIVLGLSLAVYHIAQFSTKETPFEEALAEQRQKRDLDTVTGKGDKDKAHKKPKLKKLKPKKEAGNPPVSSGKGAALPALYDKSNSSDNSKDSDANLDEVDELIAAQQASVITKRPEIFKSSPVDNKKDMKNKKDIELAKKQEIGSDISNSVKKQAKSDKNAEVVKKTQEKTDKKIEQPTKKQQDSKTNAKVEPIKTPQEAKIEKKVAPVKEQQQKQEANVEKKIEPLKKQLEIKADKKVEPPKKQEGKVEKKIDTAKKPQESVVEKKVEPVKKHQEAVEPAKKQEVKVDKKAEQPKKQRETKVEKTLELAKKQQEATIEKKAGKQLQTTVAIGAKVPAVTNGGKPATNNHVKSPSKEKNIEAVSALSKSLQEQMEIVEVQMQSSDKKKKREKEEKKPRQISLSDDAVARLLPMIHKTQLSGGEIQMLIESLLNKQQLAGGSGGEWVAKGKVDPVMQLKRQLEESEGRLKEQTDAHKALSAKIIDMRTDLNTERSRSNTLKKQLDTYTLQMQQKLDAAAAAHKDQLTQKLNELKSSLSKEFQNNLMHHQQIGKVEADLKLQQIGNSLAEVENQMKQSMATCADSEKQNQQLQTALGDAQKQLQAGVIQREEIVQTCQNYQQHLSALKDQMAQQETTFNSRMAEMQQNLSASEGAHAQAMAQLSHVISESGELQQKLNSLESVRELFSQNQVKLKELLLEKSDLEDRLNKCEKELSTHREIVNNQNLQIECLKEEKDSLASQSVRPAAEGQENGDIHDEQKQQISNNHLNAMYEDEISSLTKEVSRLKEDLSLQRRKNDEEGDKWEKEAKLTKTVLLRLFPSITISEGLEQSALLQQVEEAAALASSKAVAEVKPQIVEKIVEKFVQDPTLLKQLEDMKRENSELHNKLQKIKEENLTIESNKSSSLEKTNLRISQLETENKTLGEKVVHYQDVLSNTESLLKSLQMSVESEETVWQDKLVQKEEIVRQLTAEKANLSLRVNELQSDLEKVKQAEEMESKLNCLKEKLDKEEQEKSELLDQLNKAKEQLKAAAVNQVVSSNGPTNGVNCHEDEISKADTASLVSASSTSVSEGLNSQLQPDATNKKKKKKRSFLSKLIG